MPADTDRLLSRRAALGAFTFTGLVAMFGTAAAPALVRAAEAGGPTPGPDGWKASHKVFDKEQRALVNAYAGRIIPKTDTPGAVEAGVPDYMEMMAADWFNDGERTDLLAGIAAVDAYSRANYNKPFAKLKADQQDDTITALMNGKIKDAPATFFTATRQTIITGYYTSEIGMTVERIYIPVPGDYDGAYDYAKAGRILNG